MISPSQCRAARGLLDWSQQHLADSAKVGTSTVRNFEAGRSIPVTNNLEALMRSMEMAGVEFIAENGGGAGVRLRMNSDQALAVEARKAAIVMREQKATKGAGNDPQRDAAALERFADEVDSVHGTSAKPDRG